jgi:hypothetical protein
MDTNMAVRDASGTPQFVVRANPLGQQTEARMKPPIRIGIFDQHGDKQVSHDEACFVCLEEWSSTDSATL